MPRVTVLARTFHVLLTADGIEPFDAALHWAWAQQDRLTESERKAAIFVLNVYGLSAKRPWPPFDAAQAIGPWDRENQEAFRIGPQAGGRDRRRIVQNQSGVAPVQSGATTRPAPPKGRALRAIAGAELANAGP